MEMPPIPKGKNLMKAGFRRAVTCILAGILAFTVTAAAQTAYQPRFPGDPARSDSEAAALGYMRTVLRAQRQYNKKNGHYAKSLADLVHTGSFTRRMTNPDRGDYSVSFRSKKDAFQLALTPKQMDAQHRSFYADEDGMIHADEEKPADEKSPVVK